MTTNLNAPSQFPDRPEGTGVPRGASEQREVADIRSKLAALKAAVDSNVDARIDTAARNFADAFARVQPRLAAMPPEMLRQLVATVVTQQDAEFIAGVITDPRIGAARQGLNELQALMDGTNAPGQPRGPNQPAAAPGQSNGLGGFDLNDPLNSLKSMPFVQKIMTALTQRGIPPNLVESGLNMFVTMALTNYSKNPSIAAALVKMKVRGMRDMASRDPEVTRLLGVKRMTLDQAMAQWEATSINNLVEGRAEVTLRTMLQMPEGTQSPVATPAPATGTAAGAPTAAPAAAVANAPKDVEVDRPAEMKVGSETLIFTRKNDGKVTMKIGSTERTLGDANLRVTKLTLNERDGEVVVTAGDKTIRIKGNDLTALIASVKNANTREITFRDNTNADIKIAIA
jgi:hypothetical protein